MSLSSFKYGPFPQMEHFWSCVDDEIGGTTGGCGRLALALTVDPVLPLEALLLLLT